MSNKGKLTLKLNNDRWYSNECVEMFFNVLPCMMSSNMYWIINKYSCTIKENLIWSLLVLWVLCFEFKLFVLFYLLKATFVGIFLNYYYVDFNQFFIPHTMMQQLFYFTIYVDSLLFYSIILITLIHYTCVNAHVSLLCILFINWI